MKDDSLLIWWLDPDDVDAALVLVRKFKTFDLPEYIVTQLRSLSGRNPRGRLWSGFGKDTPEVDEDCFNTLVGKLCETRGGIVIWSSDYDRVKRRGGFVTNFQLHSLNIDKAHAP